MQPIDVFGPQARWVWAEIYVDGRAIRTDYFERKGVARLRQALPRQTDPARQFLRWHLRRNSGDQPRGLEFRGRLNHRVARIYSRNFQECHRLALLLRDLDDMSE